MNKVLSGNCLDKLKELEDNSVDSIVTDPPYELGFMGKSWDSTGIANNVEMWAECLRVLKPGGHLLAFSGTRTYHRMASAIEDAGFEVRDMIEWVYGSGFPKSLNIGKAVDKLQGNEREVLPPKTFPDGSKDRKTANHKFYADVESQENNFTNTKGTSEWEGWGTALKPAHEPICMARKPLAEKNVANNVLKWGTGGINIDESRVEYNDGTTAEDIKKKYTGNNENNGSVTNNFGVKEIKMTSESTLLGRFPANLIHDNSDEVRECFPESKSQAGVKNLPTSNIYGGNSLLKSKTLGTGEITGFSDSGNASRFFKSIIYNPKASKAERNKGCEGLEEKECLLGQNQAPIPKLTKDGKENHTIKNFNNHPTVKPIALMEYLIKMVTPKGGIVLDPFAGSGSTLVAAKQNGFQYVGIEMTDEYIKIIDARLASVI